MDPPSRPPAPDAIDRELEQLLRDAAAERERPDRRPPRGNQDLSVFDAERGREQLERVLGW
jgi:hypothetical protein